MRALVREELIETTPCIGTFAVTCFEQMLDMVSREQSMRPRFSSCTENVSRHSNMTTNNNNTTSNNRRKQTSPRRSPLY